MSTFKSINELIEKALVSGNTKYDIDIQELNKCKVDFMPGQVVLIGSRPGIGRTMFMLFIYYHLWKSNLIPQLFFSNEESEMQVTHKLISTVTGIKLSEMDEKFGDPSFSYDRILKSEQNIIKSSQSSWEDLKTDFEWLIKEKGTKAFYIDKVQGLFSDNKFNNRDQELGYIIRDIKQFAVNNQVIIFISSSLSRLVERREGREPYLSDIRESGALEDFCDIVFLIQRPEIFGITEDEMGNSLINMAELHIRKNRFGPTGVVRFTFNNEIPRFQPFNGYYQHDFDKQFYKTTGIPNTNAPF